MTPTPNPQALAAYRHLLRATRIAFQGDLRILLSARHQARLTFTQNSILPASSPEAAAQIRHGEDVAMILRRNVVQGEAEAAAAAVGGGGDGGGEGRDDDEGQKFRLRIHEEIERGDNESVKWAGRKGKGNGGGGEAVVTGVCGQL